MTTSAFEEALSRWQLDAAVRTRMHRAPTPREGQRWHALWLITQGWSAARVAEALRRDLHTIGTGSRPSAGTVRSR